MFGGEQFTWVNYGTAECRWSPLEDLVEGPGELVSIREDERGLVVSSSSASELEDAGQLRLRPFVTAGVQMSFDGWREAVSRNLSAAAEAHGHSKIGRSAKRKSYDLEHCGDWATGDVACSSCGLIDPAPPKLVTICNVRVCPSCSYVRAVGKRRALEAKLEELRKSSPAHRHADGRYEGYRPYFITLTARWDPSDANELSGERLRERQDELRRGVVSIWRNVLRRDRSGRKLEHAGVHWEFEMPYGGGLHLHAVYWGLYVDVEACRAELAAEIPRGANIDVKRAYDKNASAKKRAAGEVDLRSAIREMCKYQTKGSSPRRSIGHFAKEATSTRMDPALAAIFEVAFHGVHLSGGRGSLRSIDAEAEELEPELEDLSERKCECGAVGCFDRLWIHRSRLRSVAGVVKLPARSIAKSDTPASTMLELIRRGRPPP